MKKLVIVESPTKAKTLSGILGKEYVIKASMGHVRDLPKKGLGVDIDKDFEPEYEIPAKSKKVIAALKKDLSDSDSVVLATDLDREGEAIAWHLHEILCNTKSGKKIPYERVVFHEITHDAVLEAFSHATKLNENLFDAQQARRILDRLVGYKLSPLLWKKVRYGLSAGRVQSVAVRLIVERERERNLFKPVEYWSIDGEFNAESGNFTASLIEKDGKKLEIQNEKTALEIQKELESDKFTVSSVKKTQRTRKPYAPYKTSTLQQSAANSLGFSARRTMSSAQKLFEGGIITYHRTDSLSLSPKFVEEARGLIEKKFGKDYIPQKGVFYKTKSKGAQEAHEAIRPTDVTRLPQDLKSKELTIDELKIYTLIWQRSLECQMMPAIYNQTTIKIDSSGGYIFSATGSIIKFDGWLAVGGESEVSKQLPDVKENQDVDLTDLKLEQHFTQPPARFTDASLIKRLEELEIGRPSTYAPTITTILKRSYVRREGRNFVPDDVAFVVTELLEKHFFDIVDYKFTAELEDNLDLIAEGKKEWVPVIKDFFEPFYKNLQQKEEELKKADVTTLGQSDEKCPECDRALNIKLGKFGKFLSCSGYPDDCEFAKPMDGEGLDEDGKVLEFEDCEKCGDGKMVLKQGRFGKFLACTNYPKCKTTKPYLDKIGMKCPQCGDGEVVVKKAKRGTFYGCSSYPDCKYASWKNPLENVSSLES